MTTVAGARAAPAGSPTTQNAPESHPYTCNTCQVAFRNSDLQKGHMRGDWHRYNLKRRVASLPPIPSEVFAEKVLQARASTTAEVDKASFEQVCAVCQRTYYSKNSFENHVSSQKHKARQAAFVDSGARVADDEASSVMSSTFSLGEPHSHKNKPEVDSDAEEEFTHVVEGMKNASIQGGPSPVKRPSNPPLSAAGQRKADHPVSQSPSEQQSTSTTPSPSKTSAPQPSLKSCLFCNYNSPTVALSAAHMERFHGMFIPEKQYLIDLEGLLGALQDRVREKFECIYCGKAKSDAFAVQTHMRDTSHCKIPYESEFDQLEIGEFYDFRSTYSDADSDDDSEGDDRQNGGAKLGAKRRTAVAGQGGDEIGGEDDGWETDSSASSLDSADLTAVPAGHHYHQYERLDKHPHHSHTDPRAHHQRDGWHSHAHRHVHSVYKDDHSLYIDDYGLHLPTGKSVGHRSDNKYFRQNLRHYPSPEEREEQQRLAIEAGEGDAMDVDEQPESALATRSRGRGLVPTSRRDLGMVGVSNKTKAILDRSQHKGAQAKAASEDRRAANYSTKAVGQRFRFPGSAGR